MCGICGVVDSGAKGFVTKERIDLMASKLIHRGPDDFGSRVTPEVGLGHRRLSIIDLSSHGHQPMANEDGSIWIVFNGEIYNFKKLRDDLKKKGHSFISDTDSEAIIHLYEEEGEECLKKLRGMFAFAIWDEKKRTLFAARDRAGKKPFLYCQDGERFAFASEFGSIIESGVAKKEINLKALDSFLTFGYITAPATIYKNVFKLPPAHFLIFKNNTISIKRYWELDFSNKLNISEEEAASELMRILKESVNIRLYSDVPLGAFLSGGIDSSAIVGIMSGLSSKPVKTFSIGFKEKSYNELGYAEEIARRFNTEHHELIVKPDALSILPMLVERYGEPYADSSCIPTYYVCHETRKFVTVALNGDGGDELFAGYERYGAMVASQVYQRLPGIFRTIISSSAKTMIPDSIDSKNIFRRFRRFFDGIELEKTARYMRWISICDNGLKNKLYRNNLKEHLLNDDPSGHIEPFLSDQNVKSLLDRLLLADTNVYLPNDLLVKVDIASMANSLEARSPFLDHKLMEFAASLPAGYKLRGLTKKYILKKALKGLLPEGNIKRQKMGFGIPVGAWFRGDLKNFLIDTVLSKSAIGRGYFDEAFLKEMVDQHIGKKKDFTFQLWALLMLELWHKKFFDNKTII